jgi:hypothetical protein
MENLEIRSLPGDRWGKNVKTGFIIRILYFNET